MILLALDPGLAHTGWAVLDPGHRAHDCIRTRPGTPLDARVDAIAREVAALIATHRPDALAIEDYEDQGPRTHRAAGQAIGVIRVLEACRRVGLAAGCEVALYRASRWKPAVRGRGRGALPMGEAVRVRLGLARVPRPEHAADALGVGIYHAGVVRLRAATSASPAACRRFVSGPPAPDGRHAAKGT